MLDPQMVIPMVIENTGRGERAYDIFSMLLRNRIVMLGTPINDQIANLIVSQLLFLNYEDSERPIQMYINSPGGSVYAGLAIYDTMQLISAPVETLAIGVTASFGTILLMAGTKGRRYVLPNATIHMHQPLGGAQGQASDIEIQANEILRLRERLFQIASHHTGKTTEELEHDFDRDFYMDAEAAVAYGLADQVLSKEERRQAKVSSSLIR